MFEMAMNFMPIINTLAIIVLFVAYLLHGVKAEDIANKFYHQ